jgi:hypothetical protein
MCLGKLWGPTEIHGHLIGSPGPRTDVPAELPSHRSCMIYLKIAHLELNSNHSLAHPRFSSSWTFVLNKINFFNAYIISF